MGGSQVLERRTELLHSARKGHRLSALPQVVWQRWQPELAHFDLPLGKVPCESGTTSMNVYFATAAVVSSLYAMENGASAEIAVVGNERIVGVSLFMGGGSTPRGSVVKSAGEGIRLGFELMKKEFEPAGPVMHLLLRYTQAMITQMSQTAVCNRHHSLDQQLRRFLLLSMNRLQGDELDMTQELISNMPGVRREGVTEGALKLQKTGLIRCSRVPHLGIGSARVGTADLRMLRSGEEGMRPPAS
jgi:CRP-like cAMP-binding protein